MIVENIAEDWEQPDNFIHLNGIVYDLPPYMLLKDQEPELRELLAALGGEKYRRLVFQYEEKHCMPHIILPNCLTKMPDSFKPQHAMELIQVTERKRQNDQNDIAYLVVQ